MHVIVSLLGSLLLAQHGQPSITPQAVARMIQQYGAKGAVDRLSDQGPNETRTMFGRYDAVLDGVASGDGRWLALVPKLDPGTDAGTAEFLRIAVAEALAKNPTGVLRFTSRMSWFRDACGYPMIEPTEKEMRAYFKGAVPALKGVHDPALEGARKVCLTELIKAQRTPTDKQWIEK
jgi:hypothetical protein